MRFNATPIGTPSRRRLIHAVARRAALIALLAVLAAYASPRPADNRVIIAPKFVAGETLVYQVDTRTNTTGKVVGPIDNPESPTQASLAASLRVRLEVLSLTAAPGGGQVAHLRVTWEESSAQASSDAVNPAAPDSTAPFVELEGHSAELSLAANGAVSQLRGLESVFPDGTPPPSAILWITSVVSSAGFPSAGISPGQHWSADQPIAAVPLAGLSWHTQSTYLRAEPCKPLASSSTRATGSAAEQCVSILSHVTIARRGSDRGDATPPDYVRNGLRTSGTWTGSGEGLGSISLATGLLVSATQTSAQNYDYEIRSASTGTSVHYAGKVDSQTSITLVALTAPEK